MKRWDLPREFLRALASAIRTCHLYPKGHPVWEESLTSLEVAARRLLDLEGNFDYFVYENSFFFEDQLLSGESLTYTWLMKEWDDRDIHSITVRAGASRQDLSALAEFFSAREQPPPSGGVEINAAELTPAHREGRLAQHALRTAYSDTLHLMREMGAAVSRGVVPQLGAASTTVETLLDAVLQDPQSALLLSTIRAHDEPTFFHMVNVAILSLATGNAVGLERDLLVALGLGALLHDLGKVAIPEEILNQPGPLNEEGWRYIRKHPVEGAAIVLQSWDRISPRAAAIAYEHHLRLNGTGYPQTSSGREPSMLTRIVSVADTFDALTSRRSYRRPESREKALEVLRSGAGAHFDRRVVKLFIQLVGFHPPGSVVELSDGTTAIVVRNNEDNLMKPMVKVVVDSRGERLDEPDELDLSAVPIKIVRGLAQDAAGGDPSDLV